MANDAITYPLYELQSQTPTGDLSNLQNIYGTSAMPVFNWVQKIQTGQGKYTPSDPMDQSMLQEYQKYYEGEENADSN